MSCRRDHVYSGQSLVVLVSVAFEQAVWANLVRQIVCVVKTQNEAIRIYTAAERMVRAWLSMINVVMRLSPVMAPVALALL